ncbi:MAG: hypothetical protein JWM86_2172 [Thermoleophilia bacterium]|nr:hypothetical protein [Thermoleophilia bacterium]
MLRTCLLMLVCALSCALAMPSTAGATVSPLDTTGCSGAAVDLGNVSAGGNYVTTTDCTIAITNDDAGGVTVKAAQFDGLNNLFDVGTNPAALPDYSNGAWTSGVGHAGACLRAVTGVLTASWSAAGTCNPVDGLAWNAVQATPASPSTTVASSAAAVTGATVALRFGISLPANIPAGSYAGTVTVVAFDAGNSSSANIAVTFTVPASLSVTPCADSVLALGSVARGSSTISGSDCLVSFGTTNNAAGVTLSISDSSDGTGLASGGSNFIFDYDAGTNDWTGTLPLVGYCVRTIASATPGGGITPDGTCSALDGDWVGARNAAPDVLATTTGVGNGTVNLRVGVRTTPGTVPGVYTQSVALTVVANP